VPQYWTAVSPQAARALMHAMVQGPEAQVSSTVAQLVVPLHSSWHSYAGGQLTRALEHAFCPVHLTEQA
jgi:hypothetical protein